MTQRRRLGRWLAGCLIAVATASCDDAPLSAEAAYRAAPVLAVAEVLRYCTDEGHPECQLGPSAFANAAPHGGAMLGMPTGPVIRLDSGGVIAARYGRRGSGPGEFQRVVGAHVEADGRVILHDVGLSRRLVFASDGTPVATHTNPPMDGIRARGLVPRGALILRDAPGDQGDSVQSAIEIYVDTLPPRVIAYLPLTRRANALGQAPISGMFEHAPAWTIDSDTSALMTIGSTLRITRHYMSGASRVLVDLPELGHRPVTPADLEREEARLVAGSPSPQVAARAREVIAANRPRVPAFHPFADRLRALDDGTFLLRETEVRDDSVRWTLFDSEGSVLGQLRLSPEAEVVAGGRERLLLLAPDERDVPVLAWFAVTTPARR